MSTYASPGQRSAYPSVLPVAGMLKEGWSGANTINTLCTWRVVRR
jgi:hypothetical protein